MCTTAPAPNSSKRRRFLVADVTSWHPARGEHFDLTLVIGLLHYLDDEGVHRVLSRLRGAAAFSIWCGLADLALLRCLSGRTEAGMGRVWRRWVGLCEAHLELGLDDEIEPQHLRGYSGLQ